MVFCNSLTLDDFNASDSSHNPYFNRWFSAMKLHMDCHSFVTCVTILILIDGFLQYYTVVDEKGFAMMSQSLF